jgi:hypothetical protein
MNEIDGRDDIIQSPKITKAVECIHCKWTGEHTREEFFAWWTCTKCDLLNVWYNPWTMGTNASSVVDSWKPKLFIDP